MKTIATFSDVRLGDNLAHLHFLRALAKAHPDVHFKHAAHAGYLPQMIDVVCDLSNISLQALKFFDTGEGVNSWKNTGRYWERHPLKNEYGPFMLEWFKELAGRMGLESPFTRESDLLFDYPSIKDTSSEKFDFLVINSEPMSGQCRSLDLGDLDRLAIELSEKYKVVTTRPVKPWIQCTQNQRLTVTQIGGISCHCDYIVTVSTGASWATFNVWNRKSVKKRIIILDNERVEIAPNSVNVNTVGLVRETLRDLSLL